MNEITNNHAVGFVGSGRMAQALATGFAVGSVVQEGNIHFFDPSPDAANVFEQLLPAAHGHSANLEVARAAQVLILAVKPQVMPAVLNELGGHISPEHLIMSIAAGITLSSLTQALSTARVVRVMPNTPCLIGQGASGFACGSTVSDQDRSLVTRMLTSVGTVIEVEERLMDAVTGLSGSGPAFVFTFIEALADGGVQVGLSRDVALELATQTVLGAAGLLSQSREHPAVLRDQVTSPGGTTMRGLSALEAGAFRASVMQAVQAATERAKELAELS